MICFFLTKKSYDMLKRTPSIPQHESPL